MKLSRVKGRCSSGGGGVRGVVLCGCYGVARWKCLWYVNNRTHQKKYYFFFLLPSKLVKLPLQPSFSTEIQGSIDPQTEVNK